MIPIDSKEIRMVYKLEKPEISKSDMGKVIEIIMKDEVLGDKLKGIMDASCQPIYLYWDKVKYKNLPTGVTHKQFWHLLKSWRKFYSTKTIIRDESGNYFWWCKTPELDEFLHKIDLHYGGILFAQPVDLEESYRKKIVSWGVMEEAIASSQMEGATTTREAAKKFLREGRKPKDKSEQMILNNYLSMEKLQEHYKEKPLDLDLLFELHAMITENTISKDEQFRFRKDEDKIVVEDTDGTIVHKPPLEDFVKKEISRVIKFANDESDKIFIHPLIKAIMLHFWIGYLHPFTDGNGRLARLIFYWYLLRKEYWAIAYVPISTIIKKSPGQYRDAYIYSEQDDLDLTYFINYKIRKIKLAIRKFDEYLNDTRAKTSQMSKISKEKYKLNQRQIQLLQYLHKSQDNRTSIKSHMRVNSISKMTAIRDLKYLEQLNFLSPSKEGKYNFYYGTKEINQLFNKSGS